MPPADEPPFRRVLLRGQRLWRSGDRALHFTRIESGLAKIVHTTTDGSEAILGLFGPGDSIGDAAVLEGGDYPADAVAASSRLEVERRWAAPVLALAVSDAVLAAALREPLLRHTRILRQTIETLSAGAVPCRLATLLLGLGERFGLRQAAAGMVLLPIRLSRAELAALVGARIETAIRILSRWRRQGWIETRPQGFLLCEPQLRALAQSEAPPV